MVRLEKGFKVISHQLRVKVWSERTPGVERESARRRGEKERCAGGGIWSKMVVQERPLFQRDYSR